VWALDGSAQRKRKQALITLHIKCSQRNIGKFARTYPVSILSERPIRKNQTEMSKTEIKLKSLILAQIERWRHALHMQVERQHGGNPGGEWRTGE
jgi:hypothetical protein